MPTSRPPATVPASCAKEVQGIQRIFFTPTNCGNYCTTRGRINSKFYLSFLDDEPRPDAALIQALNDGASRIVVAEVFVSISNHTAEGEQLIKEMHAKVLGVPVVFTNPLWDSVPLRQSFVAKADATLDGTDKAKVAVILVGHGQPAEWDREFPTETEHELRFREQIQKRLEADVYRMEKMGLVWMEFREPQPAEKVKALIMNGVEKVFYFPAAISADAIKGANALAGH